MARRRASPAWHPASDWIRLIVRETALLAATEPQPCPGLDVLYFFSPREFSCPPFQAAGVKDHRFFLKRFRMPACWKAGGTVIKDADCAPPPDRARTRSRLRNPYRGQLASPMQSGNFARIAPVGLKPARPARVGSTMGRQPNTRAQAPIRRRPTITALRRGRIQQILPAPNGRAAREPVAQKTAAIPPYPAAALSAVTNKRPPRLSN